MSTAARTQSRVRFSLLWKITLPFILLAMALGLGAIYLVNRLLSQEETDRFLRQLVDGGQQAADAVVRGEIELLELERLIANTEGVVPAVAQANAEELRSLVLPLVVNAGADVVAVLDGDGVSVLTVRRQPGSSPPDYDSLRSEAYYADWQFIQRVLAGESTEGVGDKHAGLETIVLNDEQHHVFFVAGPLYDANGQLTGAVVVGEYLDELTDAIGVAAGTNVSVYSLLSGEPLSTTLEPTGDEVIDLTREIVGQFQDVEHGQSPVRALTAAGSEYWEVLTPLVARQGTETLGLMGISLLRVPLEDNGQSGMSDVLRYGALSLALIVLIGLLVSNWLTRRLTRLVDAAAEVSAGNLDARVPVGGSDEIGVLSDTFNQMVDGLREGSIYRDLLGRAVTPEVREQLKSSLADGGKLLSGHTTEATVLFADFHGYTSMAEVSDPADVMQTLNDYFAGVVPIVSLHGGVVNKFDGDSVMAFFGILPQYLPPRVSALQATHTGLAMLEHIRRVNKKRHSEGKGAYEMGIGISTGEVIAGGLGSEERLHYTVVGDTVNTAQRIQAVTRDLGGTALVISEDTYRMLGAVRNQFEFGRQGRAQLKGKAREVQVFEVIGRKGVLVEEGEVEQVVEHYTGRLPRITQILSGEGRTGAPEADGDPSSAPTQSDEETRIPTADEDLLTTRLRDTDPDLFGS